RDWSSDVCSSDLLGIPKQLFPSQVFIAPSFQIWIREHPASDGKVSNQYAFGKRTGKFKRRAGFAFSVTFNTCVYPLQIVGLRNTFNGFFRHGHFLHEFGRKQAWIGTITISHDFSFGTFKYYSAIPVTHFFIVQQFIRTLRQKPTIHPGYFNFSITVIPQISQFNNMCRTTTILIICFHEKSLPVARYTTLNFGWIRYWINSEYGIQNMA